MYSRVACVFSCIVWCICAVLVYFYPRRPLWAAPRWPLFQLNPNFLFPEIEQLSNYTITQLLMVTGESMEQLAWPSLWRARLLNPNTLCFTIEVFFRPKLFSSQKCFTQIFPSSLLSCENIPNKYRCHPFWVANKSTQYSSPRRLQNISVHVALAFWRLRKDPTQISSIFLLSWGSHIPPKHRQNLTLTFSISPHPKYSNQIFSLNIPLKIFNPNIQYKITSFSHPTSWVPLKY